MNTPQGQKKMKVSFKAKVKSILCDICNRNRTQECKGSNDQMLVCIATLRNYHIQKEVEAAKALQPPEAPDGNN